MAVLSSSSFHLRLLIVAMATALASGTYASSMFRPYGFGGFGGGVGGFGGFGLGMGYGARFGGVGLGRVGLALPVMPISYGYSYPVSTGYGGYGGFGRYGGMRGYGGYGYGGGWGGYGGWNDYDDFNPFGDFF